MGETLTAAIDEFGFDDDFDESLDNLEEFGISGTTIKFQQVVLPNLVPIPRRTGEIVIISGGISDPSAVSVIRKSLAMAVSNLANEYGVVLPAEDIVLVGSEYVTNAIRLPRKLTSCALEYTSLPRSEGRRSVGRLALFVSDNQPGFSQDPNRKINRRGLAVVQRLSSSFGYFRIPSIKGKTVFAEFHATPLLPSQWPSITNARHWT